MIISVIAAIIAVLPLTTHLQSRLKRHIFTQYSGQTRVLHTRSWRWATQPVLPSSSFSLAVSYFSSFFKKIAPLFSSDSPPSRWLMELGGRAQSNVQDSPHLREKERRHGGGGGGRGGGGWDLKAKRAKKIKGGKKKGRERSVKERRGGREWEKEWGAQLKATDLILCIIKQSHSMQHPLYIIHAQ